MPSFRTATPGHDDEFLEQGGMPFNANGRLIAGRLRQIIA
jgi:hypothetical protein